MADILLKSLLTEAAPQTRDSTNKPAPPPPSRPVPRDGPVPRGSVRVEAARQAARPTRPVPPPPTARPPREFGPSAVEAARTKEPGFAPQRAVAAETGGERAGRRSLDPKSSPPTEEVRAPQEEEYLLTDD